VLVFAAQKWWSATPKRLKATAISLPLAFFATLAIAAYTNFWHPGIYIYGFKDPWREVQEWAKANTPKDAIFITPLNKWWLYQADWRVFSERQTVTTLSEILEASFEPRYMSIWQPRVETLAPGAIAQFKGNLLENQKITGDAYNNLSTAALLSAACQYHATFIVTEKGHAHDLPQIYENSEYMIYDVRGNVCK
jgi:hypothetical protein